jgi:predicted ATP-dependent serine protease
MCIAYGVNEFFGSKIENKEPSKVLFISMEEYWRQRIERNIKQFEILNVPKDFEENFEVVNEEFPRVFTGNDELKNRLQGIIDETKPTVVFIDSMTRMAAKDIEDSSVCSAIAVVLRELANSNGISVIVIHHTHKLNGGGLSIDSLAGSRVLAQEADFLIGINRTTNGIRYYKEVATRYGQEKEDVVEFDIDDNQWLQPIADIPEHKILEKKDRRRNPENIEKVVSVIKKSFERNVSIAGADVVNELNKDIGKTQVYNYLKKLENDGIITCTRGQIQFNG